MIQNNILIAQYYYNNINYILFLLIIVYKSFYNIHYKRKSGINFMYYKNITDRYLTGLLVL